MRPAPRAILVVLLLAAGIWLWRVFDRESWYSPLRFAMLGVQAAVVSLPPINRWLARQLDGMNDTPPRKRAIVAIGIATAGMLYLYLSALQQGRDFFPKFHDEYMHLVHARMLARGRLWMPPHALPQFFETFHVFVTPAYASMQFPGTSLMYVPAMWLGLGYWVTPLLIAGATLGLMYRVVSEIIDGVAGWLAALLLLGSLEFRYESLMVLSNPPALMFGLLIIWAWLRWRSRPTMRRAMVIGFFCGWGAIVRPPDALCFAVPVGIAMGWQALRARPRRIARLAAMLGALVLAAAPFGALQLAFNRGVTGHWLASPHSLYVRTFHPGLDYGVRADQASAVPQTTLPQKLDYYASVVTHAAERYSGATAAPQWMNERLPITFKAALPSGLLIVLLPAGLVGLTGIGRWVVFATFPLFVGFYALSKTFAPQYAIITAVAMISVSLLGMLVIAEVIGRRAPPMGCRVRAVMVTLLAGISLFSLPQLNPATTEQYGAPTLKAIESAMTTIRGPAVVFFLYRHGNNVHEEPVYNIDSADIDANRIVRAQDLGPTENIKLYEYYRQRQPGRAFYRFDRKTRTLTPIDPPKEYAEAHGP